MTKPKLRGIKLQANNNYDANDIAIVGLSHTYNQIVRKRSLLIVAHGNVELEGLSINLTLHNQAVYYIVHLYPQSTEAAAGA